MITFPKQNYSLYSRQVPKLAFKGFAQSTTLKSAGQNKDSVCLHQTFFFRNLETLNFATDYITKNFKKGTNIADFACSDGEEAYSIAMLLKQNNTDKKYKIKGYDIAPGVIKSIKKRLYGVTSNTLENFIISDYSLETKEQINLRKIFNECFEEFPTKLEYFDYSPKNIQKIQTKLIQTRNEKEKEELKYMLSFSEIPSRERWGKYYYPKKDVFKGIVSFETRDISDLRRKYNIPRDTGAIFFKNAYYHLLGFDSILNPEKVDLKSATKVTKAINRSLNDNGIFVIGALRRDHLYKNQPLRTIIQNDEEINVFDNSLFHEMLKKCGFEPIFYEQIRSDNGNIVPDGAFLPSVWKKVKNI